jgi:diguanylate cyclase (GGDEF)-like protein
LHEVLDDEMRAAQGSDRPLALIMLDVDNFKRVNDLHGHQQGDRVLRECARVVRASARQGDHTGRYGGEELAIVLPDTSGREAVRVAERIRRAVAALSLPLPDGGTLAVTASLGVAGLPDCAGDREALVAAADAALYTAKHAGKDRTVHAPARRRDVASPARGGPW